MGLEVEPVAYENGFPVVRWREDRGLFGMGSARIVCRLEPADSGEILFASYGERYGPFRQARLWHLLAGFAIESGEAYEEPLAAFAKSVISSRRQGWGAYLAWRSLVLAAQFRDERPTLPMHLDKASCAQIEMHELHGLMTRVFILERDALPAVVGDNNVLLWPQGVPAPAPLAPDGKRTSLIEGVVNAGLLLALIALTGYLAFLVALFAGFIHP